MKKLTVRGIIGNTQGVISAAKPLRKEIIKIINIDLELVLLSSISMSFSSTNFFLTILFGIVFFFSSKVLVELKFLSLKLCMSHPLTLISNGPSYGGKQ